MSRNTVVVAGLSTAKDGPKCFTLEFLLSCVGEEEGFGTSWLLLESHEVPANQPCGNLEALTRVVGIDASMVRGLRGFVRESCCSFCWMGLLLCSLTC